MSTSYEVPFEPLVSDGSNYASWSIHVWKHLRKLGSLAERVVVASIIPPNFSWKNVDITNQREMDCMQLNALVPPNHPFHLIGRLMGSTDPFMNFTH